MPFSQKKQERADLKRRRQLVNVRSLNGKGYFMDAGADADAQLYIETGDERYLERLPNYNRDGHRG